MVGFRLRPICFCLGLFGPNEECLGSETGKMGILSVIPFLLYVVSLDTFPLYKSCEFF